jgi:hypothetical protein
LGFQGLSVEQKAKVYGRRFVRKVIVRKDHVCGKCKGVISKGSVAVFDPSFRYSSSASKVYVAHYYHVSCVEGF